MRHGASIACAVASLALLFFAPPTIAQPAAVASTIHTASDSAILGPVELQYLKDALRCIKMSPNDLLYTKNTHPDLPYRLRQIDSLMANPIQVPFYTDELSKQLSHNATRPSDLLARMAKELGLNCPPPSLPWEIAEEEISALTFSDPDLKKLRSHLKDKPEVQAAGTMLLQGCQVAGSLLADAFLSLSETGKRNLTDSGGSFEQFDGYETVDRAKLCRAGLAALRTVSAVRERLKGIKETGLDPGGFGLDSSQAKGNILYFAETTLGKIIIGDTGPNEYDDDFAMIIDLGGDDIYTGRAGGVDGRVGQRVSVCIDMGGNNRFIAHKKDKSSRKDDSDRLLPADDRIDYSFGGAIAGIGILAVDGDGNNTFQAGNWSLGAAHLGVGILLRDGKGDDTYQGLDCSQGAAAFGVGLLIDQAGNDTYKATYASQGFGSMAGIGLLLDHSGTDDYYAGGRYEDFPQRPKGSFIAMSQGFGYGVRPVCSGGMGILIDNSGDDHYKLDNEFGMGGSYWYGYGMLVDDNGNDSYQTGKDGDYDGYTMGAGIHLGIGCIIDRTGNDRYHANKIGPAVGWDLSPSWFIDGAGNDSFVVTAKDWNFAFAGVQNGCGFFVKKSGHASFGGSGYFPSGQVERDCGSIGILLNLGDSAQYTDSTRRMQAGRWFSGESWGDKNSTWCAGLDVPHPDTISDDGISSWPVRIPAVPVFPADTLPTDLDSFPLPFDSSYSRDSLQKLWDLCVKEEGSNWSKSDSSRTKFRSLGLPALYFVTPKMASNDGYERRCAMTSVTTMGKEHLDVLLNHLKLKDAVTKRRLIVAIGNTADKRATNLLLPYLNRPGLRLATVEALGILKDPRAVAPISELAQTEQFKLSEELRKTVAVALGRIADPTAIPLLVRMLYDSLYWGRYPAEQALIAIGEKAVAKLGEVAINQDFPASAHAIEALGRIADPNHRAGTVLLGLLNSSDWLIRGCAVEALAKLQEETSVPKLETLRQSEQHPFVLQKLEKAIDRLSAK